jgi:hypothetical protein
MRPPEPPEANPLTHISPSLYEALMSCRAKAMWLAHGRSGDLPRHPMALLGTCFHQVMEASAEGRLDGHEPREAARGLFDTLAARAHERAHPLLRLKFSTPERMPYYHLVRERAAVAVREATPTRKVDGRAAPVIETTLTSADGLLRGRPDRLDAEAGEVFDFKTGNISNDLERDVSEREKRQLLLYAHLAAENGIAVRRGTIVRGNGQSASVDLLPRDIENEAANARTELAEFNDVIERGAGFHELATPEPSGCRFCPCIPFCAAFWEKADEGWRGDTGTHVEGVVTSLSATVQQAIDLVSIDLAVSYGTAPAGPAWVEHVPSQWITVDGTTLPETGATVRVVDGRLAAEAPTVIRPDRVMTSVWALDSTESGS